MPNKSGPIAKPGLHSHANELHWPPPYKAAAANRIPVQPAAKRPGIPNAGSAAQRAQLHWPPPCNLGVKNNQAIRPLSGANAVQAAMRIRPVAAPAPYSAAPLTDNKPRRAPVIQPLLRRYSARSDLAGVFRADNGDPATQTGLDLATTSGPQQYTLPAWSIAIERRIPQGFFSRLNRVMGALTFGDDTHEV